MSQDNKIERFRTSKMVFKLFLGLLLFFNISNAQVRSSIDSTSIKIGEQITYKIEVEVDTTDAVLFPEGQTFLPLEVIESYKIDSVRKDARFQLIKKYGLTQFDSGSYTIPRQKIVIAGKEFFTDSLKVEVNTVEVDTTKQKLYDIKPIIGVEKSPSYWWLKWFIALLILSLVGFLVYWFVWREKPLTKEEKIALLPPYERAKLALKTLDESAYLENDEIKAYYSDLTLIIRKYLDEKVYDHSLESTTEELIKRLQLLRDGHRIDIDNETILNLQNILRRADLVKFAKSKPDKELAKMDRNTIDIEIDHVKESLPEPTEEERLADLKYQEEIALKKKKKRILITVAIAAILFVGTLVGLTIHYGFDYVKDTVIGHPSKELLEQKEWITSDYGAPPITMTTPLVLERDDIEMTEEQKKIADIASFKLGDNFPLSLLVTNTRFKPVEHVNPDTGETTMKTPELDLRQIAEQNLLKFESEGVENITTKTEQFITPNGQEGLKIHGQGDFFMTNEDQRIKGDYVLLVFTTENILQQISIIWPQDDPYAKKITDRVIASIELLKLEEKDK